MSQVGEGAAHESFPWWLFLSFPIGLVFWLIQTTFVEEETVSFEVRTAYAAKACADVTNTAWPVTGAGVGGDASRRYCEARLVAMGPDVVSPPLLPCAVGGTAAAFCSRLDGITTGILLDIDEGFVVVDDHEGAATIDIKFLASPNPGEWQEFQ